MLRTVVLLIIVLLGAGQAGMQAAPAPPAAPLSAGGLTYEAARQLKAGDRLSLILRGTPGGAATFHIFNVVSDVGMREVRTGVYGAQPAMYSGTYMVQPGNAVRNAMVFATLAARGAEIMTSGPRPITIDTRPPVLMARYPRPDATVANARPNIVVDLIDPETQVNPASVRLSINGQNVTSRASISATTISYNPDAPFPPGSVRVQFSAADGAGNRLNSNWSFGVAPPAGLITSVTINPTAALTDDDILTVVMAGVPGGSASFSIQGVRGERPMRESGTKGVYFGTIAVSQLDAVFGAPLVATLEKNGRKSSTPATALVTILPGQPPVPTVVTSTRSLSLEDPTARLLLTGVSRPGFRILGRVDYVAQSSTLEGAGTLGEFLAVVASNGTWRISLGPLIPLAQARLLVTVVAIDPAGRRSPPATLEVISP